MARKTNATYKKQDLIKMIVDWTCEGIPQAVIKDRILNLGYQISYFYTLQQQSNVLIKNALQHIVENKLEQTIIEMEEQYKLALESDDRRLANDIRKEINKISGLHQQRVDITTKGDKINNIEVIKIIEIKNKEDETEA